MPGVDAPALRFYDELAPLYARNDVAMSGAKSHQYRLAITDVPSSMLGCSLRGNPLKPFTLEPSTNVEAFGVHHIGANGNGISAEREYPLGDRQHYGGFRKMSLELPITIRCSLLRRDTFGNKVHSGTSMELGAGELA